MWSRGVLQLFLKGLLNKNETTFDISFTDWLSIHGYNTMFFFISQWQPTRRKRKSCKTIWKMWAIHGINHRISWHSNFPWKQADLLDLGLSENKAPQSPMGSYNVPMLKGYFGVDDIFRHSHLVHVFHEPSHLSWTNMRKNMAKSVLQKGDPCKFSDWENPAWVTIPIMSFW